MIRFPHRRCVLLSRIAAIGLAAGIAIGAISTPSPLTAPATAPVKRDWQAYPAVVELQNDTDVYALGDVHGDYDKAVKLLVGTGLIGGLPSSPKNVNWTGGKSMLVCTGDMIDKWNQGVEVVELMRALEEKAERSGGKVVVTLGNHEAEFLASRGDNKKAAEFAKELLAQGIEPADVAAGKDAQGIGAWLRNRPIAVKVNDWFFCHAGNTFGLSLKELEQTVETGVERDGFGAFVLSEPNSILEARMGPVPWWMMVPATGAASLGNVQAGQQKTQGGTTVLKRYVTALGCNHLVVGHQPGKVNFGGGIERNAGDAFNYEGVLFLIDAGMSRGAQDGHGIVMKIHPGAKEHVSTLDETGQERNLWSEP
jgi:Calcineurin-like phosphoesterase